VSSHQPDSRSLADDLGDSIARLNSRLRRDIVEAGVSLARARTLATLDREGARRLTDLASLEQVAQPTMSALIGRLEADGLVSRSGHESDGRTVVVSITDAGRDCLARLIERRSHSLKHALARLPPKDRDAISAAMPALSHLLEMMEASKVVAPLAQL
jgi:DNA-binding MarR family transcriptional regulator